MIKNNKGSLRNKTLFITFWYFSIIRIIVIWITNLSWYWNWIMDFRHKMDMNNINIWLTKGPVKELPLPIWSEILKNLFTVYKKKGLEKSFYRQPKIDWKSHSASVFLTATDWTCSWSFFWSTKTWLERYILV